MSDEECAVPVQSVCVRFKLGPGEGNTGPGQPPDITVGKVRFPLHGTARDDTVLCTCHS